MKFDELIGRVICNRSIVLFGASSSGVLVAQHLRQLGKSDFVFTDNDPSLWGGLLCGVPVINPKDISTNFFVIITSDWYKEIAAQLEGLGFQNSIDFTYNGYEEWVYGLEPFHLSDSAQRVNVDKGEKGINFIGYVEHALGLGETLRTLIRSYGVGLPDYSILPVSLPTCGEIELQEKADFVPRYACNAPFPVNLVVGSAIEYAHLQRSFPEAFADKYSIGVWFWEFNSHFPWPQTTKQVDEVWTFSPVMEAALQENAPCSVKVRRMKYPLLCEWKIEQERSQVRKELNWREETFVVFFNFDYASGRERKNTEGLLQAFALALKGKDAKLILKVSREGAFQKDAKQVRELPQMLGIEGQVEFVNAYWSKNKLMSVMSACDCYCSLHRAEGFGLGMREAMCLGLPVVGTAYGGNMEFMKEENSFLVPWEASCVSDDFGPYKRGWHWAEPSVEDAAGYLRLLYENPMLRRKIGKQGRKDVLYRYSHEAIQRELRQWLDTMGM